MVQNYNIRWARALGTIKRQNQRSASLKSRKYLCRDKICLYIFENCTVWIFPWNSLIDWLIDWLITKTWKVAVTLQHRIGISENKYLVGSYRKNSKEKYLKVVMFSDASFNKKHIYGYDFSPDNIYICGDWRRQRPKWNVNTGQRDEIGVAIQSWLWERVELMAW